MLNTPVLFIVFNRPETTRLVFEEIRKIKPKYLFIASDGPRQNKVGEIEKCKEVLQITLDVDWDCEVRTLARKDNLGCKYAVSSAINWFFDHVEEGIILEDDCLPHPSFFRYAEEMLSKYRMDNRIMHISGTSCLLKESQSEESYHFSKFPSIWGWATWKRAWKLYDIKMQNWPEIKEKDLLVSIYNDPVIKNYFKDFFDLVHEDKFNTWDIQWIYSIHSNSGLSLAPNVNLIKNIGFGPDATHTHSISSCANLPTTDIGKIVHPKYVIANHICDNVIFDNSFDGAKIRSSSTLFYKVKFFPVGLFLRLNSKIKSLLSINNLQAQR